MGIRYSYKPKSMYRLPDSFQKNSRNLIVLLLAAGLVFSFSVLSSRITGYVTYASEMESTLNTTVQKLNAESLLRAECNSSLGKTKSELVVCNDKLTYSQGYLVSCESERSDLRSYSDKLNSQFSSCDAERSDLKTKYANEAENFRGLVKNSVRAMCCSFGDSQTGIIRLWSIENNQVVCSGNYTVNCTSGSTDY